ncbi:MAG: hypothetical protein OEZ08_08480 [Betaproteobacteria bacterium]|nr:hypothetical protein [Betaproteobacteria bacterium]
MMKKHLVSVLFLGIIFPLAAAAQGPLVRFEGGIGSQPLRSGGLINDVLNINPGGRPWVISHLSVDVKQDGRISVDGRGLLLGGGGNIGRTGGQSVHARLFCGGIAHNSGTVPLDDNGDFRIEGVLSPLPPSECADPVLLIVSGTAPAGSWFAAGIPKRSHQPTPSPFAR